MILLILILTSISQTLIAKINQVHIIFRYSETITDIYYGGNYTLEIPVALSDNGKYMAYYLGYLFHMKYLDLIGPDLNYSDIMAYTTNESSASISMQFFLSGMCCSTAVVPNFKWRPIPFVTIDETKSSLLTIKDLNQSNCPYFINQLANTTNLTDQLSKFSAVFETVASHIQPMPFFNLTNFHLVYDIFYNNKRAGVPWFNATFDSVLQKINQIIWKTKYSTLKLAQMGAGVLLNQILEHLSMAKTKSSLKPRIFAYSAYDTDVAALYHLLNVPDKNFSQPNFGSSIIVELHSDEMNESHYLVKAWFGDTPVLIENLNSSWILTEMSLDVEGCVNSSAGCPLDLFLGAMHVKAISNAQRIKYCSGIFSNDSDPNSDTNIVHGNDYKVSVVTNVLIVLMIVVLITALVMNVIGLFK